MPDSIRKVTITFPGYVPSKKNSKRIIPMGKHFKVLPSESHDKWYEEAKELVKGIRQFEAPYRLELVFYPGDLTRWDMDGSHTSIQDLLVNCEIVPDDNWKDLQGYTAMVGGFSKDNPRVEVTIHQMESTTFDYAINLMANPKEISRLAKEFKLKIKQVKEDTLALLQGSRP